MKLSDFDYRLPSDLIAQVPVEPRDHSRMMVLRRNFNDAPQMLHKILHKHFFDLPEFLRAGDVLVFNTSKVIPARILFNYRDTECEIFFVRVLPGGPQGTSLLTPKGRPCWGARSWEVMVRPGKFFRVGSVVPINADVSLEVLDILPESSYGYRVVRVSDKQGRDVFSLLADIGSVPLPPYITSKDGVDLYQNVYAREPGSVAAPTAGFHFTERLLSVLRERGVDIEFVRLHVGPGTFLPVSSENITEHVMHEEFFELPVDTAESIMRAKREGRRIISVGSTSTRVLEGCMDGDLLVPQIGSTRLFIYPGYEWKIIDGLITNFHLPKSSLLMLVAAFAGYERTREAYRIAVEERYRFFSFGDGMLIL